MKVVSAAAGDNTGRLYRLSAPDMLVQWLAASLGGWLARSSSSSLAALGG
jgi:hypothetical protein